MVMTGERIMLCDTMAFPFSQADILNQPDVLRLDPSFGLDLFHCTSVPPYVSAMNEARKWHSWFRQVLRDNGVQWAETDFKSNSDMRAVFGLQCPIENANGRDWAILHREGIRFTTLAYMEDTSFGSGFKCLWGRITRRGRDLIKVLNKVGIGLDLSHAGHATARGALDLIERECPDLPVFASHSGCWNLFQHPRNLPDDIIERISNLQGVIGIPILSFLLSESGNSLSSLVSHIEHALHTAGEKAVAIGSDAVYRHMSPEAEKRNLQAVLSVVDPSNDLQTRVPELPDELNTPRRMEILDGVLSKEFGNDIARAVTGSNFVRFLCGKTFQLR